MSKLNSFLFSTILSSIILTSCKNDGWQTAETGLKYQIFKDEPGDNVKVGDVIQMHVKYATADDSVLFNTFTSPTPVTMEVPASQFNGSFEEAVLMMSTGDSAQFMIAADSIFKGDYGAARPSFIDSGSYLTFTVKILKRESKSDFMARSEKEKNERATKQVLIDEELIQKYIAEKQLKPTKTDKGVYIHLLKAGTGLVPVVGDTLKVQYTGRTLDGKVFDSSRKEDGGQGEAFDFVLGVTPIIQGWQDGLSKLKQGSRAVLILPSALAYGEQASPRFGANSVLIFDVELIKVNKPKK